MEHEVACRQAMGQLGDGPWFAAISCRCGWNGEVGPFSDEARAYLELENSWASHAGLAPVKALGASPAAALRRSGMPRGIRRPAPA